MWVMNLGKAVEVPQLNEAMAIELGATLLSEFIIFTTGATLLVAEVVRRNKKESAQEQARLDQLQAMSDRINDLEIETMRQDAQLRELSRLCLALQSQQPEKGANQAQPVNAEKVRDGRASSSATNHPLGPNNSGSVALDVTGSSTERSARRSSKGFVQQAVDSIVKKQ